MRRDVIAMRFNANEFFFHPTPLSSLSLGRERHVVVPLPDGRPERHPRPAAGRSVQTPDEDRETHRGEAVAVVFQRPRLGVGSRFLSLSLSFVLPLLLIRLISSTEIESGSAGEKKI